MRILGVVVALALVGCSDDKVPPGDPLIDYRETGGFTGVGNGVVLHIETTGRAVADFGPRSGTTIDSIEDDELASLQTTIEAARFAELHPTYYPMNPGGDAVDYIVTVHAADGDHQVIASLAAGSGTPPVLQVLIKQLMAIEDRFEPPRDP